MDSNVVQQASFDNYRSMGFSTKNQVAGRDTMGAKAEMSYKINTDVELGIGIESELFRSGYDSLTGNLSATWRV